MKEFVKVEGKIIYMEVHDYGMKRSTRRLKTLGENLDNFGNVQEDTVPSKQHYFSGPGTH